MLVVASREGVQRGAGGAWCYPHMWLPKLFRLPRALVWGVPALFTTCGGGSTLGVYTLGINTPTQGAVALGARGWGWGGVCNEVWLCKEWEGSLLEGKMCLG